MSKYLKPIAYLAVIAAPTLACTGQPHHLSPVPIKQVTMDDEFWSPKFKVWREVTVGDCFTKFEKDSGGAVNNFDLVRDGQTGKHAGPPWYDGLIYEMIRGAADLLAAQPDPALQARLDGYIERIAAAQAKSPDGYLNTWTQTMLPQTQRWGMNGGDDRYQHDLYNAGALVEAGVHYYRATGRPQLLQVATRMANLMCDTIGLPPKANVIPGHSLPEEALVKLYRLYRDDPAAKQRVAVPVGEKRYLKLAEFFIDDRGHYEGRTGKDRSFGEYGQDHAPLAQQDKLEGHAVRAALFCTGIAAAALDNRRPEYLAATQRFWENVADHRLYITGGAGAISDEEKFGHDYFLPNDGYAETCAAIAVGFFAHNMNQLYGQAGYVDELERTLYNAVLGGVSLAGDRYYYQNPLVGDGLRRWEWHPCPCCPPMFLKIMGALPGYIYAQDDTGVYVNLFVGSRAEVRLPAGQVTMQQTTRYPWLGEVRIAVTPEKPAAFDVCVRVPGWCQGAASASDLYQIVGRPADGGIRISVNDRPVEKLGVVRGYARLHRQWRAGDVIDVALDMPVRQVKAHPGVEADAGRVALMRGPVVYCAEDADNPDGTRQVVVGPDAKFTAEFDPQLLGGVAVVRGEVRALSADAGQISSAPATLTAVPFYASANRAACPMRVWLAAEDDKAVPATLTTRSRASASHCWRDDSIAAINNGAAPTKSSDIGHPRLSWWDHKGTTEWVQYDLPAASQVSKTRIFWFADRPAKGGCDLPQSWRLLYRRGDEWVPVNQPSAYGLDPDKYNETTFQPVTTTALRLEVQLRDGFSGGICQWQVE